MTVLNRDYMRIRGRSNPFARWGAVEVIIALNVFVFVVWLILGRGSAAEFMQQNFLTSLTDVSEGRIWTLLTAAFSHKAPIHIFFNMFILYQFGRVVEEKFGKKRFWRIYLLGALCSSLFHVMFSLIGWPDAQMLGASGAVSAIVVLFALENPRATLLLFFVIPMPAIVLVFVAVGFDAIGLISQLSSDSSSQIGHGAHIGGAAFGTLVWKLSMGSGLALRMPRIRRRRKPTTSAGGRSRRFGSETEVKLDRILKKVSDDGIDSLGMSEREFLDDTSRRYRDDD